MFDTMRGGYGSAAYESVERDTGVTSADPHQLIVMLFDGALLCVAAAQQHMRDRHIAAKGENISKAIGIIANGLKASLNMEVGGELALRLSALYEYMCERLLEANIHDNAVALREVHQLLAELKGSWEQIGERAD